MENVAPLLRMFAASMVAAVACVSIPASACEFGKQSSWHWTPDELVAKAPRIELVTAVKKSPVKESPEMRWEFRVVRTLRGATRESMEMVATPPKHPLPAGNTHGRASYGRDCSLLVDFKEGRQYLIFGGAPNVRAFDEVRGETDGWLKWVEAVSPSA